MYVFKSQIQTHSPGFKARYSNMKNKVDDLKSKIKEVQESGFNTQHPHLKKNCKLPVRVKIQKLMDPGSNFLEFSPLAGYNMYDFKTPAGGLITGLGSIHHQECIIIANDPTVKGGSYLPIAVKKHLRAQEIAMQNSLPCVYLVDSGGAYLPFQSQIFPDASGFGAFFYNQSRMSAMGLHQISIVFGHCTAGGAYIPSLSDETIMVKNQSAIFLGGPPMVLAATGEKVSAEDLGGSLVHTQKSGLADYIADSEESAIEKARLLIQQNKMEKKQVSLSPPKEPIYQADEIYGLVPEDLKENLDIREVLARIVDASEWIEFKKDYGKTLITAYARIGGFLVGLLANQGILFRESSLKACQFIDLCDRKNIPLVFFQNVSGFMVGKKYEREGISKDGAKMVMAVSLARVPKFTVMVGASFGAGNYGMCGRAYKPRQLWMWPSGKISVVGSRIAEEVLSSIGSKNLSIKNRQSLIEQYEKESQPYYSTSRLWDDGLIDPVETRKVLAMGLKTSMNGPTLPREKGVYRM